ncbi:carboxylesterase/lipase family protein [Bailinhaonella thermotolerans]|uniref:Carboxylic ester hydrolase n=1 Tax=Bailinhaonella thermotolerans TaxID=1070861 RepID=A0A3A4AMW7_9ACTN|nr:carboxylesterase family protein [Bailinhaonella thermotolerans]RJL30321.1 carboxylesterase/lipase family protein [Bailinhaonella thermotolerans]
MDPLVITSAGRARGRWDAGVARFLGVPYAAPPAGPLRFAAPAPPPSWDGVREFETYGPTAPQAGGDGPRIPGDEFLNLNVFTPELGAAGLPVIVWIHGGAFRAGGNASPWYDGTAFARDGVVFVAINYRLGVEGFLAPEGAPPNLGVLDWVAALIWVRDNIAAFGGDPGNVTVGGQSAGGQAAATLLAVPRARGLFARVIDMSGGSITWEPLERAVEATRALARHLGVRPTREALSGFEPGRLVAAYEELGAAPRREEDSGSPLDAIFGAGGAKGFNPVNDGEIVRRSPYDMIRDGSAHPAALLIGTTSEEFNESMRSLPEIGERDYAEALRRQEVDDEARAFYEGRFGEPREVLGQVLTDRIFRVPAVRVAEAHAASGRPAYVYEFRWRSGANAGRAGAGHCVDLPFVFDTLAGNGVEGVCGEDPPQELATRMHAAWVAFADSGTPGWPAYREPERITMVFDTGSGLVEDPLRVERRLWPRVR